MKKFLSLVLALVMTMSLVTVSAGAKDFTDSTKIQYAEAVDVMSAVKVIDGYTDGSFNPTATLTRGAAAKIICNLILGPTTASALVADAAPYKDVPTNHTFAGYIAYCQKEGIISGYADGTFKPANSLTGYAFMKMLLGSLGYKAENEGYTGANWSINVAKRALNVGLNDDLNGSFNGVKAVNREEACLYAFNTLKATMVEYEKNSTVTVGNITIKDTSAAKDMVNTGKTDGNIDDDNKMQFAEKYFTDLKLNSNAHDDFARPANQWKVKAEEIGTYAQTPDLTYTKKVEAGDIYKDLSLGSTIEKKDVELYVDGVENAEASPVAIRKGSDTKVGASGNGVLTEVFYDKDADSVIITQVNTYVGTIAKTVKATDKKDAYVVISAEDVNPGMGSNKNFETNEKFDDDAYVLYTYSQSANEIKSVELAKAVSGVVTRAENNDTNKDDKKSLTIDGTTYKAAVMVTGENLGDISVKETYDVYLDAYGYLIYVERVDEIGDYALMVQAQGGNAFEENRAVLVFADGTSKLVDTKKDYTDKENLDMVDTNGNPDKGTVSAPVIVTYKENNGVYTLRAVSAKNGKTYNLTASTAALELTNDKAGIVVGKSGGKNVVKTANSATQFVVRDPDTNGSVYTSVKAGDDWTSYVGIKNAPSITAGTTAQERVTAYYYCKDGNMVTIMFVLTDKDVTLDDGNDKVVFFANDASNLIHDEDGDYYEYPAIVNGEIKTVKVDAAVKVDGVKVGEAAAKKLNNVLYESYSTKDGYITKLTTAGTSLYPIYTDGAKKGVIMGIKGIDKPNKDYTVILGDTYTITVDEDAKIFVINTDDEITESSYKGLAIDDTALVYAIVEDYMVQTLIVYEQKSNDAPMNMAVSLDKTGTQTTTVGTELVVTATATSDNSKAVGYQWYKKTGTVKLDSKTGKVEGATKIAGATDKAFTAPTDAVSSGDTYFCVVEFYNSKLDQETAYAKSAGVTVVVNAAPEATMDIQVCYKLADGTVVATELLTGKTADSGKSYVTVKANKEMLKGSAGQNLYTLVSADMIRVPFAADTLGNVEFIVK